MPAKNSLPLPAAIGAYLQLLLQGLEHRGQLATLETAEARDHLLKTLIIATGAAACVLLTGFALTFAIAAAVWHLESRGLILGLITLSYFIIATGLAAWATRRVRSWQPLASTRQQIAEDRKLLNELLPTSEEDYADPTP